jgi:hypothetical protein
MAGALGILEWVRSAHQRAPRERKHSPLILPISDPAVHPAAEPHGDALLRSPLQIARSGLAGCAVSQPPTLPQTHVTRPHTHLRTRYCCVVAGMAAHGGVLGRHIEGRDLQAEAQGLLADLTFYGVARARLVNADAAAAAVRAWGSLLGSAAGDAKRRHARAAVHAGAAPRSPSVPPLGTAGTCPCLARSCLRWRWTRSWRRGFLQGCWHLQQRFVHAPARVCGPAASMHSSPASVCAATFCFRPGTSRMLSTMPSEPCRRCWHCTQQGLPR